MYKQTQSIGQIRKTRISQVTKKLQPMLELYTSKSYLTKNSLFNNLFSSQTFTLSASQAPQVGPDLSSQNNMTPQQQLGIFLKLYFNKLSIQESELYEFTYFHKRDKKMLIYFYILYFLENCPKAEMIVFESGDRINTNQFRDFLQKYTQTNSTKIMKELDARIKFFRSETLQVYRTNLLFLSFYVQKNQFLKSIILADINQFQSGDKSSLERIYKKIPKCLLTIALKKQIYDYKFIQSSQIALLMQQEQNNEMRGQQYELHQKVIKNINKSIEGFKQSYHSYIVPVQQIGIVNKNLEETYRSVLIRKDFFNNGRMSQFIFSGCPVEIKAFRYLNG